ncbi:alpha/beta hydrolase [Sphingobacterium paludis]|uniref:Acetyl esterase/lipase n=1 Tax=Sphingobacterium paludis TaxID=1476465 RepID=A0A4R7D7W8_9SPHI|nr:alpha/beta hydrolase [Sphingobacterium paludis]TDS17309.1 acetyl esterase/lipase [Sphingobacterium paludis]
MLKGYFTPCYIRIVSAIAIFYASVFASYAQTDSSAYAYRALIDVGYKPSSGVDSTRLDLFLPGVAQTTKVPLVIVIHGGGWAFGDKEMESIYYMRKLKEELLRNGFAVASIGYSLLSDSVHFPQPLEDCKDAVRWLYKHASNYNLDTTNFGMWGASAGAHLGLLIAYSGDDEYKGREELANYPVRLNYIVDNFGPTDLNELFKVDLNGFSTTMFKLFVPKLHDIREKLTLAMTGTSFKEDKEKVKEVNKIYSPRYRVTAKAISTLIIHGDKDKIVSLAQSQKLKTSLDSCGVANEIVVVEGGDHGFGNMPKEKIDEVVRLTIAFVRGKSEKSKVKIEK